MPAYSIIIYCYLLKVNYNKIKKQVVSAQIFSLERHLIRQDCGVAWLEHETPRYDAAASLSERLCIRECWVHALSWKSTETWRQCCQGTSNSFQCQGNPLVEFSIGNRLQRDWWEWRPFPYHGTSAKLMWWRERVADRGNRKTGVVSAQLNRTTTSESTLTRHLHE